MVSCARHINSCMERDYGVTAAIATANATVTVTITEDAITTHGITE